MEIQWINPPPKNAEELYKQYLERKYVYSTECQDCMIRGQCTSFEKQLLTAKGRCKFYQKRVPSGGGQ